MPATRVPMRKTREILRLRWGLQRSLRDTAASCALGSTTVDDAGRGIDIVDPESGTVTEAPIFVAALGASSFTYAAACDGQDVRSWIAAHIHTFEYIAGVPAITVPDNLKAGVTAPDRYEPE